MLFRNACSEPMFTYVVAMAALFCTTGAASNMFVRQPQLPYHNSAYGWLFYNVSEYQPTCGWQIILTSSYPLCSIQFWDGLVQQVDNYTFILTNKDYVANTLNKRSDIAIVGLFLNTWPSITANYLCLCNSTTALICQNVTYYTEPPTNNTLSSIPCSEPSTTTTTISTTTAQSPSSLPVLTVNDIYTQAVLTASNFIRLNVTLSRCYTGALYAPLSSIVQLIDCCALCAKYSSCKGINYHPTGRICDLITELTDLIGTNLLKPVPDCTYWKVIYRW